MCIGAIGADKPWVVAGPVHAQVPIAENSWVVWHGISFSQVAFVQGGKFLFLGVERFGPGDSTIVEFQRMVHL